MKQSFEKFCEETDLQGLSYISKSQSKAMKGLWAFCVSGFLTALISLVSYNFYLYSRHTPPSFLLYPPRSLVVQSAPVKCLERHGFRVME